VPFVPPRARSVSVDARSLYLEASAPSKRSPMRCDWRPTTPKRTRGSPSRWGRQRSTSAIRESMPGPGSGPTLREPSGSIRRSARHTPCSR
jgi:hypothetical protein